MASSSAIWDDLLDLYNSLENQIELNRKYRDYDFRTVLFLADPEVQGLLEKTETSSNEILQDEGCIDPIDDKTKRHQGYLWLQRSDGFREAESTFNSWLDGKMLPASDASISRARFYQYVSLFIGWSVRWRFTF